MGILLIPTRRSDPSDPIVRLRRALVFAFLGSVAPRHAGIPLEYFRNSDGSEVFGLAAQFELLDFAG